MAEEKTILYVEDNEHNRRIVRKILEKRGFNIIEAEDGIKGLQTIRNVRPPLVLLDISLPGMDGMEIAQRVKADKDLNHIFLIALTASAMRGDRERFLDAGCDDYMSKPFKAIELIEMVEENYAYIATVHKEKIKTEPIEINRSVGSPLAMPEEKLKRLEEARKAAQKSADPLTKSEVRLKAIRGTDYLPTPPEEKLKKIEQIKRETGQLDTPPAKSETPASKPETAPLPPMESVEEIASRVTQTLPPLEETEQMKGDWEVETRFPPIETPKTAPLSLENEAPKQDEDWVVETHIESETPPADDPQADIQTGQLPPLEEVSDSGISPELPAQPEQAQVMDDSIYYEKTAMLPPLESVLDKKKTEEQGDLENNEWLSKIKNGGEEPPQEKSIGEKIFESVNDQVTGKLPELEESKKKMDEIHDKLMDPAETKLETKKEKPKKTSEKMDKVYDAVIDQPGGIVEEGITKAPETPAEVEKKQAKKASPKTKAKPKAKTKASAKAKSNTEVETKQKSTTEDKMTNGTAKPKEKDFSEMDARSIKKQMSATLMDTINLDNIDPADPNAAQKN